MSQYLYVTQLAKFPPYNNITQEFIHYEHVPAKVTAFYETLLNILSLCFHLYTASYNKPTKVRLYVPYSNLGKNLTRDENRKGIPWDVGRE